MRMCAICGKGSVMGGKRKLLRGHYNLTKTERKYPNLQWVRLPASPTRLVGASAKRVGGINGKRVKACVQCQRTLRRT